MFVMCMTPKFWTALANGVGRSEWLTDPRFDTIEARRENRQVLSDELDATFRTQTSAAWMSTLSGKLPIAPVLDLPQALNNPYVERLGMVQTLQHPNHADLRMVANPVKVDGERTPAKPCSPLGADTDDLLQSLGYGNDELKKLRTEGVI